MLLFDKQLVNKHWRNNLILLICIIVLFVVGTAVDVFDRAPVLSAVFFTFLVFSGVYAIDYLPAVRKGLLINGVLVILVIWVDTIIPHRLLGTIGFFMLVLFLFGITISLIIHVASSKDVNANIIFSAINGYLLLGIIGGVSLLIIDRVTTEAILSNINSNSLDNYMYFSYVTLTTLGYGDLTPLAPGSRVVSMLLSISGQLYVAILIAMLVGKYLSNNLKEKSEAK